VPKLVIHSLVDQVLAMNTVELVVVTIDDKSCHLQVFESIVVAHDGEAVDLAVAAAVGLRGHVGEDEVVVPVD